MNVPRWLLLDGATATEDVVIDRLYQSAKDIGTQAARTEFAYIFRNTNPKRRHLVVPLFPLPRKIQHGMQVRDSRGHQLVQLNSDICSQITLLRAEMLLERARFLVADYFGGQTLHLDPLFLRFLIHPPSFEATDATREEAALGRIGKQVDQWLARTCAELLRLLLAEGHDVPGVSAQQRLAMERGSVEARVAAYRSSSVSMDALVRIAAGSVSKPGARYQRLALSKAVFALTEFWDMISQSRRNFIPYVLLKEPLSYHQSPSATTSEFLVHTIPSQPRLAEGRGWLREWLAEKLNVAIGVTLGWYPLETVFAIRTTAESCHFRIDLPRGLLFRYRRPFRPRPVGLPTTVFEKGVDRDAWEGREPATYHFYRRRAQLTSCATALEGRRRPSDHLRIRIIGREYSTSWIMSVLLVLVAVGAAIAFQQDGPPPYALFAPPVTIALALAVFGYDKPMLIQRIVTRITLSVVILFAGALWRFRTEILASVSSFSEHALALL